MRSWRTEGGVGRVGVLCRMWRGPCEGARPTQHDAWLLTGKETDSAPGGTPLPCWEWGVARGGRGVRRRPAGIPGGIGSCLGYLKFGWVGCPNPGWGDAPFPFNGSLYGTGGGQKLRSPGIWGLPIAHVMFLSSPPMRAQSYQKPVLLSLWEEETSSSPYKHVSMPRFSAEAKGGPCMANLELPNAQQSGWTPGA